MKSSTPFLQRYLKKLTGWVLVLLFLFTGSLFLFSFIVHEVFWEKEEIVDHQIFNFLSSHVISPPLTSIMKAITYCASRNFLQIAYGVVIVFFLIRKNWKRSVEIGVIGAGGFLINYLMKISFGRVRPPNPLIDPLHNFSFPSGHATSGFIFYGLLVYLIWKSNISKPYKIIIGIALVLFALLIGFSRVYLRVHYPSDVIAGFCIGFTWLSLSVWMMEILKKKSDVELKKMNQRN